MTMRCRASLLLLAPLASLALAQSSVAPVVPPATVAVPDCGSVVLVKCDKPATGAQAVAPADPQRRAAAQRMEGRRADQAMIELERLIVEGDGERRSPEDVISRALAQPLPQRQGTHSFSIGEGAQCTCMNICPPWPLPCCECTDRVGARQATSPGWKPTY